MSGCKDRQKQTDNLSDVVSTVRRASAVPAASSLPASVRDINVQTLYFFLALYRTGVLPKAAEQMSVSLSSANRMLARLRDYWGDPLFKRCGFLMHPTPAAKRRYDKVVAILHALEDLQHTDRIDPQNLKRIVRIACYDNAFTLGLASIFATMRKKLPHVHFHVLQADEHLFDALREDRLDLVFFARQGMHPDIHSLPVLTTRYACVVRKGHPLETCCARAGKLSRHDLAPYDQVLVNAQPDRYRAPNSPGNGYFNPTDPERIAMVVPFFLAVPQCLVHTDCYAIVPEATARLAFDSQQLSFLPFAHTAPELTVFLGWHTRTHNDAVAQYIRSTICGLITEQLAELSCKVSSDDTSAVTEHDLQKR